MTGRQMRDEHDRLCAEYAWCDDDAVAEQILRRIYALEVAVLYGDASLCGEAKEP